MARRGGKRGRTKMRMFKAIKRRYNCCKQKTTKKQYRKRKRDDDSEIEEAIVRVRDYKGKKIKQDVSDVETDDGMSRETSQDFREFSDETSGDLASCPSNSISDIKDLKPKEKDKNKYKKKKEKKTGEVCGDSKTIIEKTPTRKSNKKQKPNSKKRLSKQKREDQAQIIKGNESSKRSESAGSGNMNKSVQDPNNAQKGETIDAKEPCIEKVVPKEVVEEEQHEEESSSSSG